MSEKNEHHVHVAVLTTSGRWPTAGFEKVPMEEKVHHLLKQAAHKLELASTDDWIATVGAHVLDVAESFGKNGLSTGEVLIDFGPRHGGGGRA